MNALTPNPKTGFLESRNPSLAGFTSDKKQRFIELATQAAQMGCAPSVPNICKAVNIVHDTFYAHLRQDKVFKAAWEQTLDIIEDSLVQTMVTNGQRPSGYMDRITWLRANRPARWNPDYQPQISSDSQAFKNVIDSYSEVIDAELVPEPAKPSELSANNPEVIPQPKVS